MKLTRKESEESQEISEPKLMKYPYGIQISLDNDSMEKLGIKKLPKVGMRLYLEAEAIVESVHSMETKDGGIKRHMDFQITDMDLQPLKDKKSAAESLYGD